MKKFALIFLCILSVGAGAANVYGAQSAEPVRAAEPSVAAEAAVLMDYASGRVLWGKNETEKLPMASTTKIMTTLLALERGNLNDTVTVSAKAAAAPEVKMYLQTGEKIKLEGLLYALMLQSSNDAAIAVAEHISGSVDEFCDEMTARARELGAKNTVFETPNGLDTDRHHSTAYDMALITRAALANPDFMRIINTKSVEVESDRRTYELVNHDRLLGEYEGANGVKTGYTGKAGHCFVGAAKRGDMQLISVVLASGWGGAGKEQKWIDTKKLLNYGFDNFHYETIVNAGAPAISLPVTRSKTQAVTLYFADGFVMPVADGELSQVRVFVHRPDYLRAPVAKDMPAGMAQIKLNGRTIYQINLVTGESAERHDLKTSAEKILGGWLELGTNGNVKPVLPEF